MYYAYQFTTHGIDNNGDERVAMTLLRMYKSDWEVRSRFVPEVRIVGGAKLREWALHNGLLLNPNHPDPHSYWVGLPEITGIPTSEAHLASLEGEPVIECERIVNDFHLKPYQLIDNAQRLTKSA